MTHAIWESLLQNFNENAKRYLEDMPKRAIANLSPTLPSANLPQGVQNLDSTFALLQNQVIPQMSASAGPRYWGFVTGGTNPIAAYADWWVTLLDQNVAKGGDSAASDIERQAIEMLVELFHLPANFKGLCTTGATASNLLAVIVARQFAGNQQGIDIAKEGLVALDIEVFSACPHASMIKTLGLGGIGQNQISYVKTLPENEQMDCDDLAIRLAGSNARSKIVISSAATVTGTSFDDFTRIARLCAQHNAWLHVDAAFGIFKRLIAPNAPCHQGIELADSITLDGHKWLNVPYDCGVFLTRHQTILQQSCHVDAPYLKNNSLEPDFMSLGIENSRRFRALPVWLTLKHYGRHGIAEWILRNVQQAKQLAQFIDGHPDYELVHPCQLNVVLFRPTLAETSDDLSQACLDMINKDGRLFLSSGKWQGKSIIRAALSNWQTQDEDMTIAEQVLDDAASNLRKAYLV